MPKAPENSENQNIYINLFNTDPLSRVDTKPK